MYVLLCVIYICMYVCISLNIPVICVSVKFIVCCRHTVRFAAAALIGEKITTFAPASPC